MYPQNTSVCTFTHCMASTNIEEPKATCIVFLLQHYNIFMSRWRLKLRKNLLPREWISSTNSNPTIYIRQKFNIILSSCYNCVLNDMRTNLLLKIWNNFKYNTHTIILSYHYKTISFSEILIHSIFLYQWVSIRCTIKVDILRYFRLQLGWWLGIFEALLW